MLNDSDEGVELRSTGVLEFVHRPELEKYIYFIILIDGQSPEPQLF